jgi:hypothetical protein
MIERWTSVAGSCGAVVGAVFGAGTAAAPPLSLSGGAAVAAVAPSATLEDAEPPEPQLHPPTMPHTATPTTIIAAARTRTFPVSIVSLHDSSGCIGARRHDTGRQYTGKTPDIEARFRQTGRVSAADGLDQLAERLFALPPAEFVPARDEAVAAARAEGDRAKAAAIAKFRRPTVAAWLVNLLALRATSGLDELLTLGVAMRSAQGDLRGSDLRELATTRRTLIAGLVRQAADLAVASGAARSGLPVAEVEATLGAAVADESIAEEVRAGRLLKSVHYDGFGEPPRPSLRAVPTGAEPTTKDQISQMVRAPEHPAPPPARQPSTNGADLIRAAEAARAAVTAAETRRDEAAAAAAEATERLTDLEARLLELRRDRVAAHAAAVAAEEARLAATQALDAARRASTIADRAVAREKSRGTPKNPPTRTRNHDTDE